MEVKFYYCKTCGNLLIPAVDVSVFPICCGEIMDLLVPGQTDAAVEKHVPVVVREDDGKHVEVKVGEVAHPMVDEHYIQFVVLAHGPRFYYHKFSPGDEPAARFAIKDNSMPLAAYEFCNLHGLWKAEV